MLNDDKYESKALDIHQYSLETHKYIYEYNNALAITNLNSKKNQAYSNMDPTGLIYARCSTENDISIETQRKACFKYAKDKGIKLLSFGFQYDNNVSARNMNNLNYELGFWENQIPDHCDLIIYSVDRLSRDLLKGIQFLEKLSSRGINIHFITNEIIYNINISAAAKSMIQQELQTAEKYSNMTSEKVKNTFKRLREEGHVFGKAPYGYKHIKIGEIRKRIPDNQEKENIRKISERYNNYVSTFENYPENQGVKKTATNIIKALIRWCNRSGLKYRHGKHYTLSQIKCIINAANNAANNAAHNAANNAAHNAANNAAHNAANNAY
jgi:DNA invertase Pin-like site-specific DNA recombinase